MNNIIGIQSLISGTILENCWNVRDLLTIEMQEMVSHIVRSVSQGDFPDGCLIRLTIEPAHKWKDNEDG